MNLFILGHTKTGKTSVAAQLAAQLDSRHVAASAWARQGFAAAQIPTTDPADFVQKITDYSTQTLRREPDICIKTILSQFDIKQGSHVIEGLRNPRDFIYLFDYTKDAVILLQSAVALTPATAFEAGIEVILGYLRWLEAASLASALLLTERFASYEEIPSVVARCVAWAKAR